MENYKRRLSAALTGTALAATAVLSGAPAVSAAPAKYELIIKSVKCVDTQDAFGTDHVYLQKDAVPFWGPEAIRNGLRKNVNSVHTFKKNLTVELYEEDNDFWDDTDDFLGNLTVTREDVGPTLQTAKLVNKEIGSKYEITYKVVRTR